MESFSRELERFFNVYFKILNINNYIRFKF